MRRGRQLEVTVRWAGVNPLFRCPWGDSTLAITEITPTYGSRRGRWRAVVSLQLPPSGFKGSEGGEGSGFLGSRWADDIGGT